MNGQLPRLPGVSGAPLLTGSQGRRESQIRRLRLSCWLCPNFLSDLVGAISPFCLLPTVKRRPSVSLKVLWALQKRIAPEIYDIVCMCAEWLRLFPIFTVGGGRTGKRRVERKMRSQWSQSLLAPPHQPREPRGPGAGKGHMPTVPAQPGFRYPSRHPQFLLSFQQIPLQHQGSKSEARPSPTRWH